MIFQQFQTVALQLSGPDIGLLPPSAFVVKPKPGDPWKEIAKATEEVTKLRIENTQLR